MTAVENKEGDKPTQQNQAAKNASPTNHKATALWGFTFLLVASGLIWLLLWIFYFQYRVSTDDAYANGNMIAINTAINGSITAFYADNTDLVMEGQLLVTLDSTYYEAAYEKALAELAVQAMQIKEFQDDLVAYQAALDSKKNALSKARFDYENRAQLVDSKAVSNEDFVHSKDSLNIAENEMKQAESLLKVAQDKLGYVPLERHPLLEVKKAAVRDAYYNCQHCKVYAPATGYIAQRSVNVGQFAMPTTDLMAIIPADYVWVDANFKETQLVSMRIGQPATVWFDLYGSSVKYEGKVLGIASGTGSVFSLIPPQNATGNWIKIVQRLPVRISLDPEMVKKYPVRLGISAKVTVDITEKELPSLAQVASTTPVANTNVYDIGLGKINRIIYLVIKKHLYPYN